MARQCALCAGTRALRVLAQPGTFPNPVRVYGEPERGPLQLGAGSLVCERHQPIELEELLRGHALEADAFLRDNPALDECLEAEYDAMMARHRRDMPAFFTAMEAAS